MHYGGFHIPANARHVKQVPGRKTDACDSEWLTEHRILKVVYILISGKEPYRDPEIDYEALVVHRNAPRRLTALRKYHLYV